MDFQPDQQAREELEKEHEKFSNFVKQTVAEAEERLAKSGEKGIPILIGRDLNGTIRSIVPMGPVPPERGGSEVPDED